MSDPKLPHCHPYVCLAITPPTRLGPRSIFLSKGRSTTISFEKEAIEHHEPKLTTPPQIQRTHTNSPNKTLLHLNLGEKPKKAVVNRAVVTNVVSRQKPRPAAS
jgi:hypothetical protein